MACTYHGKAEVKGVCECGKDFCSECAHLFTGGEKGKQYFCSDCAAKIASKKIFQSYIAAGIGFIFGLFAIKEIGYFAPIFYAYMLWAIFFGWHFGGRIWSKLGKIDFGEGWIWGIVLFSIRVSVAVFVGMFGGGIYQFILYRKLLKRHSELLSLAEAQR